MKNKEERKKVVVELNHYLLKECKLSKQDAKYCLSKLYRTYHKELKEQQ